MSGSGPDRVLIRLAVPADEPQIADTVTTAFGAAEGPVVARLVKALQASPAWDPALSFVAVDPADQVIGYVLATASATRPRLPRSGRVESDDRGRHGRRLRDGLAVLT
jgi:predicted N-acetyltransferase YhbS